MDSFIKYYGGKSQLSHKIVPLMPRHKTYIEPFGGACWVLFRKPLSTSEIINDIDSELINLYLVLKHKITEFISFLKDIPVSEDLFKLWAPVGIPILEEGSTKSPGANGIQQIATAMDGIPDVDLAAKFYYLIMLSFNGNISGKLNFKNPGELGNSFAKFYNTDWAAVKGRLKNVTILNRDFGKIIEQFDGPDSFFYFDPPYTCSKNSSRYYRYTLQDHDYDRLMVYLSDITGKFILSFDPESWERYTKYHADFNKIEISNKEILIMNYDPPEYPFFNVPCSKGIPHRSAWYTKSCPRCGSRDVQRTYKRIVKNSGRTWVPIGYTCDRCGEMYSG